MYFQSYDEKNKQQVLKLCLYGGKKMCRIYIYIDIKGESTCRGGSVFFSAPAIYECVYIYTHTYASVKVDRA